VKYFSVVWHTDALDQLADIWIMHPNRDAVSKAVREIDTLLGDGPLNQGGELSEGIRFFLFPPLRVLYTVSELDRLCDILFVRVV
jgi:hypothetical protein